MRKMMMDNNPSSQKIICKIKPVNKTLFTRAFLAAIILMFLTSGIIRHDVNEQDYLNLANEKQFDAVGQIYLDTSSRGSCILINERYVISAAHVFIESDYRLDSIIVNGQKVIINIPYNNHIVDYRKLSVIIKGHAFKVKNIKIHPNYLDSASKGSCDLAIIELGETCKDVKPAKLNLAFDELNSNVTGVGFGVSGIANKPETVKKLKKKIAGQNVIDSIEGFKYSEKSTLLLCDFDHPNQADCNKMGSAIPMPLEYICGGGDSGGGLFRQKNNQWELIGICQSSSTNIQQLLKTGYYGQIMSWTRVAAFQNWITENSK